MRLISVENLLMKEFFDSDLPKYACLSHRWSTEEVTFQEWNNLNSKIEAKSGYRKIIAACSALRKEGIKWLWADTCCIDKTNSTELSEAINSMWKWYRDCSLCVAYLQDVAESGLPINQKRSWPAQQRTFRASEWFRRAWTLQELIAPNRLEFFDRNWQSLGSKGSLFQEICSITGIDKESLLRFDPKASCVARKMSWAASRRATRSEDVAYSLLGLFDVNMPMLYGEGDKAFIRLQEEILRRSTDTTILAWESEARVGARTFDFLAANPQRFEYVAPALPLQLTNLSNSSGFFLTNAGLEIALAIAPWRMNLFIAAIISDGMPIWRIVLQQIDKNTMRRCKLHHLNIGQLANGKPGKRFRTRKIVLTTNVVDRRQMTYNGMLVEGRRCDSGSRDKAEPYLIPNIWSAISDPLQVPDRSSCRSIDMKEYEQSHGTVAIHLAKTLDGRAVEVVLLGFDDEYNPMCMIYSENIGHYSRLLSDAEKRCPHLFDSTWTRARWDDHNSIIHVEDSHQWMDLGQGAFVFKSRNQEPFTTGTQTQVQVRFEVAMHDVSGMSEFAWRACISQEKLEEIPVESSTIKSLVQAYRLRTFGPNFGIDHLEDRIATNNQSCMHETAPNTPEGSEDEDSG